ncbi:MAG: hypothetical protein DDT19_00826 [Syntrophomonadaceae bacterium]|nr:hypothetical protein [Bacillota bacterium]
MWIFNATADRVVLLNPRAVAGAGASLTADNRFTGNQTFQGRVNTATSVAGTADAITATYVPPFTAWVDKMHGRFRATGANTTTAPTFSPDGLVAKIIVKENLVALAANDIAGAGHEVEWIFNATADRVILLNPRVVGGAGGGIGGSGTLSRVARFTAATTIGDSVIFDDGTRIGVGTTLPSSRLHVVGVATVGATGGGGNSSTGIELTAPAGAAGTAGTGIMFRGDGVAHANIAWMANERNFIFRSGNSSTDTADMYGPANILVNGRIGIGTTSPQSRLSVGGNATIGSGYIGSAGPADGLAVQGNVGMGILSPTARLHVVGVDSFNTSFAGNISGSAGTGLVVTNANNVGIGTTTPTATLHLRAGTATAGTAPLKFTSGPLNTTPEPGAIEFLTDAFHGTITTGAARRTFAFLESPTFTGTVTIPTPFTLGAVSVTATGTELNRVAGVTSPIQTQIDARAPIASPTFTGNVTMPGAGRWNSLGNVGIGTIPETRLHVAGTTRGLGGAQILALPTPATPTVTPQGATGTTTWGYRITARSSVGETLASIEGRTTTGNATLSTTNFNRITWPAVSGAVDYRVYRTTAGGTPSTTGLIGTVISLTFDDTGLAASGAVPTVDTSGNIGVGTANPNSVMQIIGTTEGEGGTLGGAGSILHVRQNAAWSGRHPWALFVEGYSYLSGFRIFGGDGPRALFQTITGSQLGFATAGDDPITFTQSHINERMRIASGGNVSIGGIATPSHQFQLSMDSAGKPATNTWTIVSDKRLKKSIEPANLDLCYNAVKTIPLSFYRWRDDVYTIEQVRDRGMLGWIADDVEKVYPKAVKTIPFEFLTKEKIEDCKSVNNDQVYAALYGAVQKLIEKVEALERRIR